MKTYLAAVRHLHVAEGFGNPRISEMVRLEQVLRGVKSLQSRVSKRVARLPITPDLLLKINAGLEGSRDYSMLWAAATLCFFGFMRAGEITIPSEGAYDASAHMSFEDVAVDSLSKPQTMRVRLKASKTDPFRLGVDIFLGRVRGPLCPVAAMLNYLTARGPGPGPLLRFADGRPLTRARFVSKTRAALQTAKVDVKAYSGHSFRIGAATTAARQGISDASIKMLGRWKSSAYQLYIKTPRKQLAEFSQQLVSSPEDQ